MLNRIAVAKSLGALSYSTARRSKVRILPKEHYDEYETPFMKAKRPGKTFLTDFYAFVNRKNFTLADVRHWQKWKRMKEIYDDQKYMPERHKTLGPDLATAHFITVRGGKVKFKGNDQWMDKEYINKEIPSVYIPGFYIEELDATGTLLCYEGFENLCKLHGLKKLILSNCTLVDDWCLNRSYLFKDTLEYLDISGCHKITERGICTLHVLKKLNTLVMHDTPYIQNKELVSLLLQEIIPKCEVIGVDYNDPVLVKRIENYMN